MNFEVLSLILDIAVLIALGVGVYFAVKMTRVLDNFKKARKEMNGMIQTLTTQINKAEKAMEALKQESYETADELRGLVRKALPLAGELKVMTESAGHIADRLERVHQQESSWEDTDTYTEELGYEEDLSQKEEGFFIQDREFEEEEESFRSEAERELFKVLKGAGGRR